MAHFVGLDVSVEETSVCVVDDVDKVAPCSDISRTQSVLERNRHGIAKAP